MPKLELTNDQVMELVKQLPAGQQEVLFRMLLVQQWGAWEELSRYAHEKARRAAAARGLDWDAMTEEEREIYFDEMVHEERKCAA